MHNISVLAMFKNESMIIQNWIEHYLREGIDHFYLIDNGSTDDYEKKIDKYKKYITLVKDPTRKPKDTQTILYNEKYLPTVKKETTWLIICDIDEYIFSRNGNNKIMDALNKLPEHVQKIWLPWKCFGSNGIAKQPTDIIKSFTKRKKDTNKDKGYGKIICKTKHLNQIQTCGHIVKLNVQDIYYNCNGDNLDKYEFTEDNCKKLNLHLNHYMLMSEEYYKKIKCTRGGGESGKISKYTMNTFNIFNKSHNNIDDKELANKIYK